MSLEERAVAFVTLADRVCEDGIETARNELIELMKTIYARGDLEEIGLVLAKKKLESEMIQSNQKLLPLVFYLLKFRPRPVHITNYITQDLRVLEITDISILENGGFSELFLKTCEEYLSKTF